jgi:hypothetical protein
MQGHGSTITFASGFIAEILDLNLEGLGEREAVRTSHFGTAGGFHTYEPSGLAQPGRVVATIGFNPLTPPPYTGAAETVTIDFPGSSVNDWAASGFMVGMSAAIPHVERATAEVTLQMSGAWTIA